MTREKKAIESPLDFLKKLRKKADETNTFVKDHYAKIKAKVKDFRSEEETILFYNDELCISAYRHRNVYPRPFFTIIGVEIIVRPCDNNYFTDEIHCSEELLIKIYMKHDKSRELHHFEDSDFELGWECRLASFGLREEGEDKDKLGIMSRPQDGSWDNEIAIDEFDKFIQLKTIIEDFVRKNIMGSESENPPKK